MSRQSTPILLHRMVSKCKYSFLAVYGTIFITKGAYKVDENVFYDVDTLANGYMKVSPTIDLEKCVL